jgi:hypothetical protein
MEAMSIVEEVKEELNRSTTHDQWVVDQLRRVKEVLRGTALPEPSDGPTCECHGSTNYHCPRHGGCVCHRQTSIDDLWRGKTWTAKAAALSPEQQAAVKALIEEALAEHRTEFRHER